MKNPNAIAALSSSQAVIAIEQLVSRYLGASVGAFWEQEIMAAATVVILYIGRHGLRAAFARVFSQAKSIWAPPAPAAK